MELLGGALTASNAAPPRLRRDLNLPALVALSFFCVAGGAYGLEDAVGAAGPAIVLLGLIVLPWIWSLPTALMTAELSTAMPEEGGYVAWVERAFGRFWGFQEGWLSWLCSFADNALYPVMFVDYLAYLRGDMAPAERWLIGASLIGVITWLNIRGIRLVGISLMIFLLIVLAPFAALVALGLPQVHAANWFLQNDSVDWTLLLGILLWNTSGWDNAGCCAAEVADPSRAYPRAMLITVAIVTVVYLLPVAVGVGVDTEFRELEGRIFSRRRGANRRTVVGHLAYLGGVGERGGPPQRAFVHLRPGALRDGAALHVAALARRITRPPRHAVEVDSDQQRRSRAADSIFFSGIDRARYVSLRGSLDS